MRDRILVGLAVILGILLGCSLGAQTVGTPAQIKGSGAPSSALCVIVGQEYFQTDATPGANLYYCTAAGIWTLVNTGSSGNPGYTPNGLISGGGVEWVTGLQFTVGQATYRIGDATYSSVATDLTLSAADPTNPRIDMVTLTSSGTAVIVAGTAAASPVAPVVDPSTQLALAFINVAASGTTPTGITYTAVYKENVEWTTSAVGGTFNLASTNFPYTGSVDIEGTSVIATNYVQFVAPSTIDLDSFNNLTFYIRSKATWPSAKSLQLRWYNSTTARGVTVVLASGQFGFVSSTTGAYQQIQIPMSLFGLGGTGVLVDRLRITCAGGGGSIGMYMDQFTLQSGISEPPSEITPAMVWKGTWNATASYAVNDVVNLSGVSYVSIAANVNSSPTPSNANWAKVGGVQTYAAVSNQFLTSISSAGLPAIAQPSFSNISGTATAAQIPSNVKVRTFGASFISSDGVTALTAGATAYFTIPYTCTISAWNIAVNAGTATVDIWKIATGTAIPTGANTITASATPAIAANTAVRSTTLTGWTTSVAANDIVGINLEVVATATQVNLTVECNQ